MKVIISNLAWIERAGIDEVSLYLMRNDLTIVPKGGSEFAKTNPIYLYATSSQWFGVPRPYYFKKKKSIDCLKNAVEEWQVSSGVPLSTDKSLIILRPEDQEPAAQFVVNYFKDKPFESGAVEAYTSFGKTIIAFEIIRRVGLNTIVILHREALMDQWVRSCEKWFPEAKLGYVQGKNFDYIGKDITFSMLQTLMSDDNSKFPNGFFEHFGMVVADECHTLGAEKFGSVIPKFSNRYTLQLSGTIRRQDGCENVFKFSGGDIIHKVSEQNRIKPVVYLRDTQFVPKRISDSKTTCLSYISESKTRCELIANDIVKAIAAGRYPLVMSERLEQLRMIKSIVERICNQAGMNDITHGLYIGGKTEAELMKAADCSVVYATIQLAKEGIDIPRLCCCFLASPVKDNEQISGRIVRRHPDKKTPLLLDYVDLSIPLFRGLFISRFKLYKRLGFEVKGVYNQRFSFVKYLKG